VSLEPEPTQNVSIEEQQTINEYSQTVEDIYGSVKQLQEQIEQFSQNKTTAFKEEIEKAKAEFKDCNQKLVELMQESISETVWAEKLGDFNRKLVVPQIETVNAKLAKSIEMLKKSGEESYGLKLLKIEREMIERRGE
jgi:ubiquinone/menaquinone biosynthesis C-methylase UbiE